jgi:nucleoside-diphosphate-sugar epimerase
MAKGIPSAFGARDAPRAFRASGDSRGALRLLALSRDLRAPFRPPWSAARHGARFQPGAHFMKALITGASGFVGGSIWRRARTLKWTTLALGRRALPDADYRSADLSKPLELDFQPDVVIHAAARSSPWGRRRDYEAECVATTRTILDFCATRGCPHLIHISTAAVLYENKHQLGLNEESAAPRQPINEYARAKTRSEELVRGYAGPWCILRPRAVFGPGDTVVFPRILRALERGRLPCFQSDQPVQADLIFIETLADYVVRCAERRATGIYHLSQGEPVEIQHFIRRVCAELGLTPPRRRMQVATALRFARVVEFVHRALPFLGEPPVTAFGVSVFAYSKTLDAARAFRDLGPPSVDLEEGFRRFIAGERARRTARVSSA